MIFTEPRFLALFGLVFCVHWALRGSSARKAWLLAASYAFYAAWDWRFLSLIAISTLVDYVVGLRLVRPGARRRFWLNVSLVINLGLLGFFKYCNFFLESAVDLIRLLGGEPNVPTLQVVLPVGISFYTFQTLSYSLDIYYGRLRPTRSFLDLALFVAFFPQLVAGPIMRATNFLPQLGEARRFASVNVRAALILFFVGFVKKACISDNLAPFVDPYFAAPEGFDAMSVWMATLGYSVQLYCDFSGYSDMAIATAALLGYRLVLNFDFPYFSRDIGEVWRRWHISLSTWFRDYLYIPLGGSRGSKVAKQRNMLVVMLVSGLWHGAAWHYVLWGALQWVGLAIHGEWRRWVPGDRGPQRIRVVFGVLLTFWFWCIGLIFFRSTDMTNVLVSAKSFLFFVSPGDGALGRAMLWIMPPLIVAHAMARWRVGAGWYRRLPGWGFAAIYAILVALALPWIAVDFQPFVYFQF